MIKLLFITAIIFLISRCIFAQEMLSNPRCNHYPERGSCEQSFEIKWYYDRFDHRCRRFHYGGCEGNENRFDTLIECEQSCHFDPQIDEISSRRCFQPHDPGTCWGNFERWYFDSNLKRCVCSWWSGCGGNSNRFYSYPHCMQICGEHAVNNAEDKSAPDDTVYESPMQRLSEPHQIPSPLLTKPATQILARPRDTQPLGGGILYPSHVSTPQHPPIYDDPDLFKIHPVFEDDDEDLESERDEENIEEFETTAYRNPRTLSSSSSPSSEVQEWSAKTETRFFPNLGLRNRTFTNTGKSKKNLTAPAIPTVAPVPISTAVPNVAPEPLTIIPPKPILTVSSPPASPPSPSPSTESENGMLLNLRPPAEFLSKNKKRNVVEAEVVETNFRTTRQSRRSSGTSSSQPSTPNGKEEFETEFQKQSPAAKKENYEKYDTPHSKPNSQSQHPPPQLGYAQASSQNPRTRYHEEAETQFLRHSYINPPIFPGYPILKAVNSDGYRVPQPVPQGLINQLIAQHLALRERLGQTQKVPVIQVEKSSSTKHSVEVRETPFRRLSTGTAAPPTTTAKNAGRTMTYAEKRRRWKEEMKRKLKKQKIPPRQIIRPIITGEKNKYYVTYSPYYRLYQVSRQPPKGLNFTDSSSTTTFAPSTFSTTTAPLELISPEPPVSAPPPSSTPIYSTSAPTTTPPPSTTPKVISLKVEPAGPISPTISNKMSIRVAAIKPSSEPNGKQLLYMDDEDEEWRVEEEDYYVDENGQPTEKLRDRQEAITTTTATPVRTTTPDDGLKAIVYPVGYKTGLTTTTASSTASVQTTTTRKSIEHVTAGADYILPPESPSNNKHDYNDDYGHSEEDLFFWKPEFENRRTRIDPSSQPATATESFNEELPPSTNIDNDNDNDAFEITVHNPNKKKL